MQRRRCSAAAADTTDASAVFSSLWSPIVIFLLVLLGSFDLFAHAAAAASATADAASTRSTFVTPSLLHRPSFVARSSASSSTKLETKMRMALRNDEGAFFSGALREGLSVGFVDSEVRPLPSSWSPEEEEEEIKMDNTDSHYIDSLSDQNMNRNTIDEAEDVELRGDNTRNRDDDSATISDNNAVVAAKADAELVEEMAVEEEEAPSSSSFHHEALHDEDTEEEVTAVMDDAAATNADSDVTIRAAQTRQEEPVVTLDEAPSDDGEQWEEQPIDNPVMMMDPEETVVVEPDSATTEENKLRLTPKEDEDDDDADEMEPSAAQQAKIDLLESNERHLLDEISDLEKAVVRAEEDRCRMQRSLESAHADLARVLFKCTCLEQRLTSSSVAADAKKRTRHDERRSWWGGGERKTIRVGGATKVNGGEGVVASPRSTSFELNGQSLGNGAYLLAGRPHRSASENNVLWTAYRAFSDDNNVGGDELLTTTGNDEALMVKVSSDRDAIRREYENYQRLLGGASELNHFVKVWDMLPDAEMSDEPLSDRQSAALVMERGSSDLTTHMAHIGRGLVGSSLQDAGRTALRCLKSLHDSDLCWTDLKSDNFVVFGDPKKDTISFKGIDLESARPVGECPIGFSPEACPPEFAAAFLSGTARDFRLDFSYDVWSFGIYMYELSTGKSFFEGKSPAEITNMLPVFDPALFEDVLMDCVPDRDLADLIGRCLQLDPERRPTVDQILQDPFFRRATSTRSNRSQHAHML